MLGPARPSNVAFAPALLEHRAHDAEFLDRRVVQQGLAVRTVRLVVQLHVDVVGRLQQLLLRRLVVVRQNVRQRRDVLELRGEARADDVVAARHAFDDVAADVRVDVVCFQVHGLAGLELHKVQEE